MTFDASINPIAYEDGEAVFIDTEYETWNPNNVTRGRKRSSFLPRSLLLILAYVFAVCYYIAVIPAVEV